MGTKLEEATEIDAGGHPVVLGPNALRVLDRHLLAWAPSSVFVLGDENTLRHCLPELLGTVANLRSAETIAIAAGESSKSLPVCQRIWEHLAAHAADRGALIVALGGGVVTDVAGFIAATYKRGVRCVLVPTSLLGMVDAAIGGKTGIDLGGVKNTVGAFHDPLGVYVHVPFLKSLGKRELLNGVAEMIKHGLVQDASHYEAIRQASLHDLDALEPLIASSAAIKSAVVKDDPRESGARKLLNFGHTIGHGLEAFSWEGQQRNLQHGEAVAIGMVCEAWLSWRAGLLDRESNDLIAAHLRSLYKPFRLHGSEHHRVIELMRNDKKNHGGEFRFTLLTGIGSARVDVPVTAAQVHEALEHYRLLVKE
ncbi:MAG: 3-dehydroquinate synthase [Flavobacteriales bacterium]|nr:3-dehydroquinate synthase [Flavobacteriales bacterium]